MQIKIQKEESPIGKVLHNQKLFPIFTRDTLETILDRYYKFYPDEANGLMADVSEDSKNLLTENGMSSLKLLRLGMKIPVVVFWAMKFIDDEFWFKDNAKNFRKFISLCPKLCTKGSV